MLVGIQFANSNEGSNYLIKKDRAHDSEAIIEALGHISEKYYGEVDSSQFVESVLKTMVSNLDTYSHYWDNKHSNFYNQYLNGSYFGRGIELFKKDSSFFITTVIEGGPAEKALLLRGDQIVEINNLPTVSLSIDSIQAILAVNKDVSIKVFRKADESTHQVNLHYEDVKLPLVRSFKIENTDIIYLSIERFTKDVFINVMDELDAYKKRGITLKDLIIDVRNNPGGLIEETVKLLNQFISERDVLLLSTKNNKGKLQEYKSNGRNFFDAGRIVVLINEKSASASEILAGSLQDLDRAVILGQNSFGKGLIQQSYQLTNGGSLSLTVGEYLLPSGRSISRVMDTTQVYRSLMYQRVLTAKQAVSPDIYVHRTCQDSLNVNLYNDYMHFLIDHDYIFRRRIEISEFHNIYQEYSQTKTHLDKGAGACEADGSDFLSFLSKLYRMDRGTYEMDSFDNVINEGIIILKNGEYEKILSKPIL